MAVPEGYFEPYHCFVAVASPWPWPYYSDWLLHCYYCLNVDAAAVAAAAEYCSSVSDSSDVHASVKSFES